MGNDRISSNSPTLQRARTDAGSTASHQKPSMSIYFLACDTAPRNHSCWRGLPPATHPEQAHSFLDPGKAAQQMPQRTRAKAWAVGMCCLHARWHRATGRSSLGEVFIARACDRHGEPKKSRAGVFIWTHVRPWIEMQKDLTLLSKIINVYMLLLAFIL